MPFKKSTKGAPRAKAFGVSLVLLCFAMFPSLVWGQQEEGFLLGSSFFSENPDKTKLVLLNFSSENLSEGVVEQVRLVLESHLRNQGSYSVIGPSEAEVLFAEEQADLVDCQEVSCGITLARELSAEQILQGVLAFEEGEFHLKIQLLEVESQEQIFQEELRFTDRSMGERLFELVNDLYRNSELVGRILEVEGAFVVVNLGHNHGLARGDQLVVESEGFIHMGEEGKELAKKVSTNVAILELERVNPEVATALVMYAMEKPKVGQRVRTYPWKVKQIALMEQVRREIDTAKRFQVYEVPVTLEPVQVVDMDRQEWQAAYRKATATLQTWKLFGVGSGLAGLWFLQDSGGEDTKQLQAFALLGAAGYAGVKYLSERKKVDALKIDGKSKGYLSFLPGKTPKLLFAWNF